MSGMVAAMTSDKVVDPVKVISMKVESFIWVDLHMAIFTQKLIWQWANTVNFDRVFMWVFRNGLSQFSFTHFLIGP
jgi:hypothetical protein